MLIVEYRIPLPFTLEEWQKGQQYMIAKASLLETDGREGIEVLKDEPFQNEMGKGNFTHKVFHLTSKLPEWTKKIVPDSVLQIEEKSWNIFPYSKTVYRCPIFGDRCKIIVETIHKADNGETYNIHKLNRQILKERIVDLIDIAEDTVEKKYYRPEEDPTLFKSKKTKRGPLQYGWRFNTTPIICAYKLVIVEFNIPGFRKRGEKLIHDIIRGIYLRTHRQAFCWIDEWIDISMDEIKKMEDQLASSLKITRNSHQSNISKTQKVKHSKSRRDSNEEKEESDPEEIKNDKDEEKETDDETETSVEEDEYKTNSIKPEKQTFSDRLRSNPEKFEKKSKFIDRSRNTQHQTTSKLLSKVRSTFLRSKL